MTGAGTEEANQKYYKANPILWNAQNWNFYFQSADGRWFIQNPEIGGSVYISGPGYNGLNPGEVDPGDWATNTGSPPPPTVTYHAAGTVPMTTQAIRVSGAGDDDANGWYPFDGDISDPKWIKMDTRWVFTTAGIGEWFLASNFPGGPGIAYKGSLPAGPMTTPDQVSPYISQSGSPPPPTVELVTLPVYKTLGLYQDTACTIPATDDGHSVAAWRDEISSSGLIALMGVSTQRPFLRYTLGVPWLEFDGLDDILKIVGDFSGTFSISSGAKRNTARDTGADHISGAGYGNTGPVMALSLRAFNVPSNSAQVTSYADGPGANMGTPRKNGATSPLTNAVGEWCSASVQGITCAVDPDRPFCIGGIENEPGVDSCASVGIISIMIQVGNISVSRPDNYIQNKLLVPQ